MPNHPDSLWTKVDKYFGDLLVTTDEALDAAVAANHAAKLPAIDITPLQGSFLELLVRMSGARRILEIGTLGGYSTIWLARALPKDGRVTTLELEPHHAAVARANFQHADVHKKIDILLGPAADTLRSLIKKKSAPFDLIFIDADKSGYPEYLTLSLKLSRPGTVIVADNVVRDGKVINSRSKDQSIQGVRRFIELVAAEPRLRATVLQTVCGKGYDGFFIGVVVE